MWAFALVHCPLIGQCPQAQSGNDPHQRRILLNLPLTILSFDKAKPDCSSIASTMDAEPIGLRLSADHLFVTSHLIAFNCNKGEGVDII